MATVLEHDHENVARLLGRPPQCDYKVVVRRSGGQPAVIENEPFLFSGVPMPTRYWLIDPLLNKHIGRLESAGGVDNVEAEIGLNAIGEIHTAYEKARDQKIPSNYEGPKPTGGVGGTRIGVKCLHAHYANYLAGNVDAIGEWVETHLPDLDVTFRTERP